MICLFVRLKATFVLTFVKSFGTGTYAIKTSFLVFMTIYSVPSIDFLHIYGYTFISTRRRCLLIIWKEEHYG